MRNEDLVLECLKNAHTLGRKFAAAHGLSDKEEWESRAVLQMVRAALKFDRRPVPYGSCTAMFWSYCRRFIWARLLDDLRGATHDRSKQRIRELQIGARSTIQAPDSMGAIEARVDLVKLASTLTPGMLVAVRAHLNGTPYQYCQLNFAKIRMRRKACV